MKNEVIWKSCYGLKIGCEIVGVPINLVRVAVQKLKIHVIFMVCLLIFFKVRVGDHLPSMCFACVKKTFWFLLLSYTQTIAFTTFPTVLAVLKSCSILPSKLPNSKPITDKSASDASVSG